MNDFSIHFQGNQLTQTKDGIFVNDRCFLSAIIQSITPHYHFTSYSSYSKGYVIKLVETKSYFPDKSITLYLSLENPKTFFGNLNSVGLKSDFLLKDSIEIWKLIVASTDNKQIIESQVITSERSGWIFFNNDWHYMTSEFAVSKSGADPKYHCTNPYACLSYDKDMDCCEAFSEIIEVIKLDFNEVAPILVGHILSFLQPIAESEKLYSIPGLFISGATSTGKTELALAFGTLFGNFVTKDIQNFLILQSGIKEFEHRQQYFSDTTFLLDDARKSPSYSVRQSTARVLDTLGRSAFTKNNMRLTPIVTGEPETLSVHLESLRNRFVEIYLNSSPDKMASRKVVISKLKENPVLLKTCLFHFIVFICKNIGSSQLSREINRIKEDFSSSFDKQITRIHDNLFMHYLGFRLFLYYGKSTCRLSNSEAIMYADKYKQVLTDIGKHFDAYTDKGQAAIFIHFLCNSIKEGRIKIYIPEVKTQCKFPYTTYDDYYDCYTTSNECLTDSYGHFAVIDMDYDFHGVYIQKRSAVPGCEEDRTDFPVLLLNIDKIFEILDYETKEFQIQHGYKALSLKRNQLKQILFQQGILYVEKRYETGNSYCNYTCQYPHWISGCLCSQGVFCINIKAPISSELADCIQSLLETDIDIPDGCLYQSISVPIDSIDIDDLQAGCSSLRAFR